MSAERLERAFAEAIASRMEDAGFAVQLLDCPTAVEIDQVRRAATQLIDHLRGERRDALLARLIVGGSISPDAIAIELAPDALAILFEVDVARIDPSRLSITAPLQLRRRGVEARIVIGDAAPEIDRNLIAKIGQGMRWFDEIKVGASIKDIATRNEITSDRVAQILRLAWLAPALVDAIASGEQPARLTANTILKSPHILLWSEQHIWIEHL